MSLQFDFLAGLDISSLSSVTQAQLMQMVNQIAPLSNIGAVIYGTTTPDVANNPRFARYLWIDSSTIGASTQATPKYYNTTTSAWVSVTVPSASIGDAQLAAHVEALTHMFNAAGASAHGGKVLVYDASGTLVTQVTKESLVNAVSILLSQISTSGAALNNVIKNTSTGPAWSTINLVTDVGVSKLPLANLEIGTAGYLLQMVGGTPTWVNNDDSSGAGFLPSGTAAIGIPVSKLKLGAANQIISMNTAGTAIAYTTQALRVGTTAPISVTGLPVSGGVTLATGAVEIAHGFGFVPKLFRVVAVLGASLDTTSTASQTYAVGDEVEINSFESSGNNMAFAITADVTNISVGYRATGAPSLLIKAKLSTVVLGAIDETKWTF